MKKQLFAAMISIAMIGGAGSVLAGDEAICLDCHEPAEDWEGMSAEEILAEAKDASIKRHKDNQDLSDEQLQAIIAELLQQ